MDELSLKLKKGDSLRMRKASLRSLQMSMSPSLKKYRLSPNKQMSPSTKKSLVQVGRIYQERDQDDQFYFDTAHVSGFDDNISRLSPANDGPLSLSKNPSNYRFKFNFTLKETGDSYIKKYYVPPPKIFQTTVMKEENPKEVPALETEPTTQLFSLLPDSSPNFSVNLYK